MYKNPFSAEMKKFEILKLSRVSWILIESHFSEMMMMMKQSRSTEFNFIHSLSSTKPFSRLLCAADTQIRWKFNSNFQMQCDAINLVLYKWRRRRRTWDDGKTLEKYWKYFFTLQWRKKAEKKERWNIVVVVVYCKIALAKGISAFCSIIKSKAKKHHMTEFSSFFVPEQFAYFFILCCVVAGMSCKKILLFSGEKGKKTREMRLNRPDKY